MLKLPPPQEREGDLDRLIDRLLEQVNPDGEKAPGYPHKNLCPSARNLMLAIPWAGFAKATRC
jgi:transcriptional regulator with PAS, ATPase and Fis domain